ncbi:MAG: hypothetical protein ABSG57_06115 [Candidatus Bathyarchaeia archaeon]
MKIRFYLVAISLLLALCLVLPVYANAFRMMEGDVLQYEYERVGSTGGGQTGNVTFTVTSLNQTMVTLQVNGTSGPEEGPLHIKYDGGIPVYADLLEALVYLPSECLARSLQGKLDWIMHLEFGTLATVANETSQTQSFTVAAGSFKTINLTLSLVGWEYGTLDLIYSVDSGILVYESWVPSPYGDMIVQELTSLTYPFSAKRTLLDIALPTATLVLPAGTAIDGTRRALHKLRLRKHRASMRNEQSQNSPQKTSFYMSLTGALLILASVLLPWSQLMESQVYLPSSLPVLLGASSLFSISTFTFVMTSLLAHATAILVWLGIVLEIYAKRKPVLQLVIVASALVGFASALVLVQAGWSLSWGSLIVIAGGVLVLVSAFAGWDKRNITRLKRS